MQKHASGILCARYEPNEREPLLIARVPRKIADRAQSKFPRRQLVFGRRVGNPICQHQVVKPKQNLVDASFVIQFGKHVCE